jgi:hypothetical protein
VNPYQTEALAALNANRARFFERYPNQWIVVSANGEVRSADRFDMLDRELGNDAERVVFAFVAVGAWA